MSELLAEGTASPSKGWVRDGVLSFLARHPGTATEIARELGVSKATVSYHTKALIRRDMIEILDVKTIRGGVYSKTYALKRGSLALARRKDDQQGSLTLLDEWFERLLMSVNLEPDRRLADELKIFLYHLYRLLAASDSLEDRIFEEYGRRVGEGLVASSLRYSSARGGLKELARYMNDSGVAQLNTELRKGSEPRLVCTQCLENKEHGGLVCSFTKGLLTGAIKARDGGAIRLERAKQHGREPACVFVVRRRGFKG